MRPVAIVTSALLVLFVAACGPVPKPFQPRTLWDVNPLAVPEEMMRVRVEPVEGITEPTASQLGTAVAAALGALDIPSAARLTGASRYVLKGRLVDAREPDQPWAVDWTLEDSVGVPIGTRRQMVDAAVLEAPAADDAPLRASATVLARSLAGWIDRDDQPTKGLKPVGVAIGDITGAPGDGNTALARSIRLAMKATNITVVDVAAEAPLRLDGTVAVDPPLQGRQRIKITWSLVTATGQPVGQISQDNALPQGSFDGAWGRLAAEIAAAAAPGIADAVGKATPNR